MEVFYREFPFRRDSSVTPFYICHITYEQNLSFSPFFGLVRDLMSKVSPNTHCGGAAGNFIHNLISFQSGSELNERIINYKSVLFCLSLTWPSNHFLNKGI